MSWPNRLQPTIQMTSPDGNVFNPKWRGNDRSREKKLGLFTYPDVPGTVVQDLDVNSTKWPMIVYFDGADYDLESEKFFNATAEKGLWEIIHPTKGTVSLQLVSVTEPIQPIESGNIAAFNLDFIQPANISIIQSLSELQNGIQSGIIAANDSVLNQVVNSISNVAGNARTSVNNAVSKINGVFTSILSPLARIDNDINSAYNSITRGLDTTINNAVLFPEVLVGQIQSLVQLPAKINKSATQKLNTYTDLIFGLDEITGDDKFIFAIKDLALSAALGAVADIVSDTDAQTRAEIVQQIEKVSSLFDTIVNSLDNDMSLVDTDKIENQYISQEGSFPQNYYLTALAINYLLRASIDLAIEKRFYIKDYSLPIMLTIKEYGSDIFLDFFNSTNKLKDDEFLLLPPGREVVVYPGLAI